MKLKTILLSMAYTASVSLPGAILEDFQFNDAAATELPAVANSAGTAGFVGASPNAVTNGTGQLVFTVGADTSANLFRNAALTTPNVTSGKYELSFSIPSATLAGGDATGANVGVGLRDDSGTDLFQVRLHRQNSELQLQTRVDNTNTTLQVFGGTSIADLAVRVVVDLDSDTFDIFWSQDGATETSALAQPLAATGLEMDFLKIAANTNTTDWGATDQVLLENITLADFVDSTPPAIHRWDFNELEDSSLNFTFDSVEGINLNGFAFQAFTDGVGNMQFGPGEDATDDLFRTVNLSAPDQATGRFQMEWYFTSAQLAGLTNNANFALGARDTTTNTDLFLVRLAPFDSNLRLQSRGAGTAFNTLENFQASSVVDLNVRVVFDLDSDTFDVFHRLGNEPETASLGTPLSATGLEFDALRIASNSSTDVWGPTDLLKVDFLEIINLDAEPAGDLELCIANGPATGQVTLSWPTSSPAAARLESSPNLQAPWTPVTNTPVVNGSNNEVTLTASGALFYRLTTEALPPQS